MKSDLQMFSLIRRVRQKETDNRKLPTVDEDVLLAEGEQVVVHASPATRARGCWTVPPESMCLARTCQVALGHLTGFCGRQVVTRRRVLWLRRALHTPPLESSVEAPCGPNQRPLRFVDDLKAFCCEE